MKLLELILLAILYPLFWMGEKTEQAVENIWDKLPGNR